MHSPPPTPSTRSNARATRKIDVLPPTICQAERPELFSKKRTREQAGLITPRETPRKQELSKDARSHVDRTAKILFPATKRRRFQVFQDPQSPDPFLDDIRNPFAAPETVAYRPAAHASSSKSQTVHSLADVDLPVTTQSTTADRRSASPRRTDGMTYVFRGRKVFRKYSSIDEGEAAEAVLPKRLFVKEMTTPKLSNPFDTDEIEEEEGFDGLELSTCDDLSLPTTRGTSRQLF